MIFEHERLEAVESCAASLGAALREGLKTVKAAILGPAIAPFAQLRGKHRHHLMLKLRDEEAAETATSLLRELAAAEKTVSVKVDVDAVSML